MEIYVLVYPLRTRLKDDANYIKRHIGTKELKQPLMSPKTRTEKPRRRGKDKAWDTNCLEIKLRNNVGDTEGRQRERQSVLWGLMGNPLSGPQILTTTKK